MERLICLAMGYVFGLFQTGYFYGLLKGTDLSKQGSGNTGATNTLRVMGAKSGAIVLLGDVIKCLIPCFIARALFAAKAPELELLYVLYSGCGAILGHNFPFFRHFKGGKGIACTGALIIAILDLRVFLISLCIFLATVYFTRYVSLGSILGCTAFFISFCAVTMAGLNNLADSARLEACAVVLYIAALGIFRHRANIVRLKMGTESKIHFHK